MSLLARLARSTLPVARGGRHFVSAKPPKLVLQPGREKTDNNPPTESSPPADPRAVKAAPPDETPSSKPAETHPQCPPVLPLSSTCSALPSDRVLVHPTLSPKEYKLHHFFSLHRPLLLLNQPTTAIFDAANPSTPLFTPSEDPVNNSPRPSFATIDNPPESSPDADADAARQLAHTLVMNRVGGAIAWQLALSRLGLGDKSSENDMTLAKGTAQEWVTIHADSTRRKKRKKMKKHKLKKRRRLTRRQNK